jgi:hypothetical protein
MSARSGTERTERTVPELIACLSPSPPPDHEVPMFLPTPRLRLGAPEGPRGQKLGGAAIPPCFSGITRFSTILLTPLQHQSGDAVVDAEGGPL